MSNAVDCALFVSSNIVQAHIEVEAIERSVKTDVIQQWVKNGVILETKFTHHVDVCKYVLLFILIKIVFLVKNGAKKALVSLKLSRK